MAQENDTSVDTSTNDDTSTDTGNDSGEDTTTSKDESAADKASRLKRQLKQHLKKHGDELGEFDLSDLSGSDDTTTTKSNDKKSDDLDYGQLAYLKSHGIESDDEIGMVEEAMQDTGKSLKDVLSSKFFQAALNEARETAKTNDAIPKDSKRQGETNTKETPEYWLKKGELPPPEMGDELRRKVVNLRLEKETSGSKFSDEPVVS